MYLSFRKSVPCIFKPIFPSFAKTRSPPAFQLSVALSAALFFDVLCPCFLFLIPPFSYSLTLPLPLPLYLILSLSVLLSLAFTLSTSHSLYHSYSSKIENINKKHLELRYKYCILVSKIYVPYSRCCYVLKLDALNLNGKQ